MSHLEFNFGNALFHFRRTGGPKGFLRMYVPAFALVAIFIQVTAIAVNWPVYELYLRMFAEGGDIETYAQELNQASMRSGLISILMFPLGILVWMVFETASLRRYMRADKFRLRVGADEWRVLVVGLIWFGLLIAAYIGLFVVILVPVALGAIGGTKGLVIGAVIGGLMMLFYFFACVWVAMRLSPAAALTVRDSQIRFFEAWRVTKGRVGTLLGAWFVMAILVFVVVIVAYGAIFGVGMAQFAPIMPALEDGSASHEDILALVTAPAFWVPLVLLFTALLAVQGAMQHIFGGPAALAAKTDPNWVGQPGITETFN
jgi:hypothetical protein